MHEPEFSNLNEKIIGKNFFNAKRRKRKTENAKCKIEECLLFCILHFELCILVVLSKRRIC